MAEDLVLRGGEDRDEERMVAILSGAPEAAQWKNEFLTLVAEAGGEVVGFAVYRIVAGEGELLNLAVDARWRKRGVATALLKRMMTEAELWHLEVRESNEKAIAVYERFGFERVGERRGYYRDGETALLYSCFSRME